MIELNETLSPELTTIAAYSDKDQWGEHRKNSNNKYKVKTISLLDLLKKHAAPQVVDYLSIDTEGSELDILSAFFKDNNFYQIKIITCEHNYTKNRQKIYQLLLQNNYSKKHKKASK